MNAVENQLLAEPRSTTNAPRALEALAAELPAIEGSAIALGGRGGGPAPLESDGRDRHLQRRRTTAVDAIRRLGAMYVAGEHDAVHALWWAYVRQSTEVRAKIDAGRAGAWFEELGYMLLPLAELAPALRAASRRGAGPHAAMARTRGATMLARAEALFEDVEPLGTDGAWIALVRDAVDARAGAYREAVHAVTEARARERKAEKAARAAVEPAAYAVPEQLAPEVPEAMHPFTALRICEGIGFVGAALVTRMCDALLAGDFGAVVGAAVERGLAQGYAELLAGVTDEDRAAEREKTRTA